MGHPVVSCCPRSRVLFTTPYGVRLQLYTQNMKAAKARRVHKPHIWSRFRGRSMHGNVVLNFTGFPKGELGVYAHAYHEAANRLVGELASRIGYSDVDACPVVFLYRHAIELYLKSIVYWGNGLLRLRNQHPPLRQDVLFRTHNLGKLVAGAKPVLKLFRCLGKWPDSEFMSFRDFARFIMELDDLDPGSYSFRYPIDRKGGSALPNCLCFNVVAFGGKLDSLLNMLSGAAAMAYEQFLAEAEATATQDWS
jgi:hypothetical protein